MNYSDKILTLLFSLICFHHCLSQDLSQNLLINYNFDGNYLDNSSNAFHGTPVQTTFTTDRNGINNSAIQLPGNSSVDFPDDPLLKPQFPLSVAVWINPIIQSVTAQGIFGNDQTENNYYGAFVSVLSSGKILASYGSGCGDTTPSCRRSAVTLGSINSNEWYHIAVNFIDEETFEIYINGCLVPTEPSGSGALNMAYTDEIGAIGKKDHSDFSDIPIGYLVGLMDDFYYWDRVLTQADVDLLVGDFFNSESEQISITHNGCIGDGYSITINDTVYDENNPTGVELVNSLIGCDSIFEINLTFNEFTSESFEYLGCSGDGFQVEINSNIYDESNPLGQETLTTSSGCDSIIDIDLTFTQATIDSINYLGCIGDGFQVESNATIYNELNPIGQENLTSSDGCDSTIIINLVFEDAGSEVLLPNIFTPGQNQNNIFRIRASSKVQILNLQIFDRWGNIVYDNDNTNQEWDGTVNGQPAPSDVYIYTVTYQMEGQEQITSTRDLTLVR